MLPLAQAAQEVPIPERDKALHALRSGSFSEALRLLDNEEKSLPSNPITAHLRGITLVALGRIEDAEEAFTAAIERGPQLRATPTGLEEQLAPRAPLFIALSRQKTQLALEAGIAAARNNRGAVRLLLRRPKAALEDMDQAAVLVSDWGVPWANAALIQLEMENPAKALFCAREAQSRNERSAWALAVLAECERRTGQLSLAEDHLNQAQERDAGHPYVLAVRAALLRQQARLRDSERALSQALALSPETAADSRFVPRAGDALGIVGNLQEQNVQLLAQGLPGKSAYRISGQFVGQRVEGRQNGDQASAFLEGIYGRRGGATVLLTVQSESGGRPGAAVSRAGVDTAPDLRFTFGRESLRWQQPLRQSAKSRLLAQVGASQSRAWVRNGTERYQPVLREETLQAELRYETLQGPEVQAGLALARIRRSGESIGPFFTASPIEPSEQVLPNGSRTLGVAYAARRWEFGPNLSLTAGGMADLARGSVAPLADLALRTFGNEVTHLRLRPRLGEAATGLVPLPFLADSPQPNPIDRKEATTHAFNRTPTLLSERGRFQTTELALPPLAGLELAFFEHQLDDAYAQATDSRLASGLALTPVQTGRARGVRLGKRVQLGKALSLKLESRFQETNARLTGPTYREDAYPAKVETAPIDIPNFPRWQGGALLEGQVGTWQLGLEGAFLGRRSGAFTVREGAELATYLSTTSAAAAAHLHLTRSLGARGSARLTLFNLGRANFYPGYPARTTLLAGWDISF